MTRLLLMAAGVIVAAFVISMSVSSASTLTTTTKKVASGVSGTAACGSLAGATVAYEGRNGNVVRAIVSGLPAACNGAQLSLTLTNNGTDAGHGGPVTIAAQAASVSGLSATPVSTSVTDVRIVVVGP